MPRSRLRLSALGALAVVLSLPALAEAQLFPRLPTWKRHRPPCEAEPPVFKMYREQYYGYYPTCWRRFPPGWGCPSPEAPNLAASLATTPLPTAPADFGRRVEDEGPLGPPGGNPDGPAPLPGNMPDLPPESNSPFDLPGAERPGAPAPLPNGDLPPAGEPRRDNDPPPVNPPSAAAAPPPIAEPRAPQQPTTSDARPAPPRNRPARALFAGALRPRS